MAVRPCSWPPIAIGVPPAMAEPRTVVITDGLARPGIRLSRAFVQTVDERGWPVVEAMRTRMPDVNASASTSNFAVDGFLATRNKSTAHVGTCTRRHQEEQ